MKTAIGVLFLALVVHPALSIAVAADDPVELSDAERAFAYARMSCRADRYVLNSDALPAFELERPEEARAILGEFQLKAVVYGSDYRVVSTAARPGRYGAVVEITPAPATNLRPSRRFVTLYRLPDQASFDQQAPALMTRLKNLRWNFKDVPGANSADAARELAALHDVPRDVDPQNFYQQPIERERQWWIGLKRRLYGFDQHPRFAAPFRAPRPVDGQPGRVIRPGTLAEAGMKPDAARHIDEVLQRWSADSDEGFDVCIVRHGVVVLRQSYGKVRGQPVTDTTMFHLTSTSKFLTGLTLMMTVDQERLDLDRPITELPGPLHGIQTDKPLTVRGLYTHSAFSDPAGLQPTPDLEERLAVILPHLQIGQGYQYTGTSLELAWALASLTTGESISTFARDHLFAPLGCQHTEVFNTGGSTQSTAHDMACILQMVLNQGAYAENQFLRAASVEEMLPRRLTKTLGPYTNDRVWGIGTMPWKVNGLSPLTFGHKGYFRSTAFIDPVHDLVVVMLRVDPPAGKKYDQYHPQFLQAIVAGLVDRVPSFPLELTLAQRDVPPGRDRLVIEAAVENSTDTAAVLEYNYETQGTHWRFDPASATINLPPHSRVPIRVEVRMDLDHASPLPKLHGTVYSAAGPKPLARHVEYWLRPIIRRSVTARRVEVAPISDGQIGAAEYGQEPESPQLLETHGRKTAEYPTWFRVAYDDRALYVAVAAAERPGPKGSLLAEQRDDPKIKTRDYVELVVQPTADVKSRRQFAINRQGLQYDALDGDATWNATWTATARPDEGDFQIEFVIPYESLGSPRPRPGETWALNVLRGRGNEHPKWERLSQWVMTYADENSADHVGVLQFR